MKPLHEIIDLSNEPQPNFNMRIEINLDERTAKAIEKKATDEGRSRKNYIEQLCIKDVTNPMPIGKEGRVKKKK